MLRSLILVILLFNQITNSHAQSMLGAIGEWREQYNNKSVQHLIKGDKVYGATTHQLFSIDNKNNIVGIVDIVVVVDCTLPIVVHMFDPLVVVLVLVEFLVWWML